MMNAKPFALTLAAATAAVALSACATTDSPSNAAAPSAATQASPEASPAALVLGPDGFGSIKLRQSFDDAVRTGLITVEPVNPASECELGRFKAASADQNGVWFDKLGVASITYPGISTPEGVHIGTSFQDMKKAYPTWRDVAGDGTEAQAQKGGRGLVPVPGNAGAVYRIAISNGVVSSVTLQSTNQGCYE